MNAEPSSIKGFQLVQRTIARAVEDDEHRRRLLADPKSVLRQEGLDVPDDVEVVAHENAPNRLHVVVPSRPVDPQQLDVNEVRASHILEWAF